MSRINLGRRGARAKLSTLDTAHKPSPTARKGPPPGQKGPIVPTETTNNPHRPEKRTQMAITDYAQNRNHKQSATEAHQQDKPARRSAHASRSLDPGHRPHFGKGQKPTTKTGEQYQSTPPWWPYPQLSEAAVHKYFRNSFSSNFCNILRKIPLMKSLFTKIFY